MKTKITIDAIRAHLKYDPETGVVTWKVAHKGHRAGMVAGSKRDDGYIRIIFNGRALFAHRVAFAIMTARDPTFIDHIDHDRSNNKWENLREVTKAENSYNMKLHAHNTSGICGVSWRKDIEKWRAYIHICKKRVNIGYFDSIELAVAARKTAEKNAGYHPNHGHAQAEHRCGDHEAKPEPAKDE